MEEKELWMNKLKEKLADYSEPTPASGWEQLEKELMPPVEKKIYPYRKWMMAAAAVILLAVVSSVSLYFLGTPAADEMRHIQTPALASTPDALPGVQQPDVQGTSAEPVLRPVAREDRLAKADRNIPEHKTLVANEPVVKDEPEPVIEENEPGKAVEEGEPAEETNAGQTQTKDTERPTASNRPRRPSGRDKYHIPTEKPSSQKGTWSMGLGVGNSGGASSEVGSGAYPYSRVSMLSVSNGLMQIPNDQTLVLRTEYLTCVRQNRSWILNTISLSLSDCQFVRLWAKVSPLESGLTYTLLSSDAKLADNDQQIEQKLHYIGIPLRTNWNFLDKKLVTLYVSGGGMIEKCVYGKLGSEKETVKPLQFSVSGAVGAQLNATKRVGIYVEPGVAYYFDDGSDIQTIRKENPFNFNIQAGIRLTY